MNTMKTKLWVNKKIGWIFYWLCIRYKSSTGICESTTRGYGKLNANGYWQFPIEVKNPTNYRRERYLSLWRNIKARIIR